MLVTLHHRGQEHTGAEAVQNRALRMCTRLKGHTYEERLREVGMFSLEEDWNNLPNINQAATSSAGAVQEEAGGPFGQGVNHGRQEEGEACKPRPGKSVSELWAGREPACLPES